MHEELLNALASSKFKALRNYGDRWGISHVSFDGESIASVPCHDTRSATVG
jgi:hypothetical protein